MMQMCMSIDYTIHYDLIYSISNNDKNINQALLNVDLQFYFVEKFCDKLNLS